MRSIILKGEPRSTQHIYKYTCRGRFSTMYMSAEGKALKESYRKQAKEQWIHKPRTGDIKLDITLYFGTKRRADIDNFNKLAFDSLTGIVFEDDSQIQEMTIRKNYDKILPRIEILIK